MKNVRLEALPHAQDYRKRLKDIIAKADPAAEIVDPLEHVGAIGVPEELRQHARKRAEHVALARRAGEVGATCARARGGAGRGRGGVSVCECVCGQRKKTPKKKRGGSARVPNGRPIRFDHSAPVA